MMSTEELANCLKLASNLLDADRYRQLKTDIYSVCQQLLDPSFRIAVFAPFNQGKSTLLNAILGANLLPTDIFPTTGAAIRVKYGETTKTSITFVDGQVSSKKGTEILEDFTVLDEERRMRKDIVDVEVQYPHPLLKTGVELLDLPGTEDGTEQDILVRDQLLKVDLVIQILDARKQFTLSERENLKKWLLDRGIKVVIFVVNFLNLEKPENQKKAYNRALSIANNIDSDLPYGVQNLYRVDAQPAFDATEDRNIFAMYFSGLFTLRNALYTISKKQYREVFRTRIPRVITIATQVKQIFSSEAQGLDHEVKTAENIRNRKIQEGQELERSIKNGFTESVNNFRNWLSLINLQDRYLSTAASATKNNSFYKWQDSFNSDIQGYVRQIEVWANQACDAFNYSRTGGLNISLPDYPSVSLPSKHELGFWGGVKNFFQGGKLERERDAEYNSQVWQAYQSAIRSYLSRFSNNALSSLRSYEERVEPLIRFQIPPESSDIINKRARLKELNLALNSLKAFDSINQTKRRKVEIKLHFSRWIIFITVMFLFGAISEYQWKLPSSGYFYAWGLGKALAKNYDEAISNYEEAKQRNPLLTKYVNQKLAEAYFKRGAIHEKEKNHKRAILDHETAKSLDTKLTDAANNSLKKLYIAQSKNNPSEAINLLTKLINIDPSDLNYISLGDAYTNRGKQEDLQQAIDNYSIVINRSKNTSLLGEVHKKRGNIYDVLGNYSSAINDYITAKNKNSNLSNDINPILSETYIKRAVSLSNKDEAIKDLNEAITVNPNNPHAYEEAGKIFANKGMNQRAINYYKRAIEKYGNNFSKNVEYLNNQIEELEKVYVYVKNDSASDIYVAILNGNQSIAKGWYKVNSKSSNQILVTSNYQGNIYIGTFNGNSNTSGREFCLPIRISFVISIDISNSNNESCTVTDYKKVYMSELSVSLGVNYWSFTD